MLRNRETWRERCNRPFVPKPYRVPYVTTPGLDDISAWLRLVQLLLQAIG